LQLFDLISIIELLFQVLVGAMNKRQNIFRILIEAFVTLVDGRTLRN
jgi:hypothetical protein